MPQFDRFTEDVRQVLVFAHDEAKALEHPYVGTEHLLLGAIEQSGSVAGGLELLGATLDVLLARIEETTDPDRRRASGPRPFTPRAKRALEAANDLATDLGDESVRPEHIVLALIEAEDAARSVLAAVGAEPASVTETMLALLSSVRLTDAEEAAFAAEFGLVEGDGQGDGAPPSDVEAVDEPHLNGKEAATDAASAGEALLVAVDEPAESILPPACPRCDASLLETIRWRQHVAPGANDEPMMIYLVFCSNCGRTLQARIED